MADNPAEPPGDSPAPEQPRLGVMHLLIWSACVALDLGINQLFIKQVARFITTPLLALSTLYSLASGAALGGILLLASRRLRGLAFPRHPGECVLVALGFGAAATLIMDIEACLQAVHITEPDPVRFMMEVLISTSGIILGISYLVRVIRVEPRWWRLFFAAAGVVAAVSLFLPRTMYESRVFLLWFLLPQVFLFAALVADWRHGRRYPWTHWLGVAVNVWYGVVTLGLVILG